MSPRQKFNSHMFESWPQLPHCKCFRQQTLTIWTLPELLWRIFLCHFFINLQTLSLIWILQHNVFTEKILRKCFTIDWLLLREADNFIICITFLWLIKISQMLVIGNWCKFVCFKVRAAWSLIWFCTTDKFSWH